MDIGFVEVTVLLVGFIFEIILKRVKTYMVWLTFSNIFPTFWDSFIQVIYLLLGIILSSANYIICKKEEIDG
jgi:hypothetical protein